MSTEVTVRPGYNERYYMLSFSLNYLEAAPLSRRLTVRHLDDSCNYVQNGNPNVLLVKSNPRLWLVITAAIAYSEQCCVSLSRSKRNQ